MLGALLPGRPRGAGGGGRQPGAARPGAGRTRRRCRRRTSRGRRPVRDRPGAGRPGRRSAGPGGDGAPEPGAGRRPRGEAGRGLPASVGAAPPAGGARPRRPPLGMGQRSNRPPGRVLDRPDPLGRPRRLAQGHDSPTRTHRSTWRRAPTTSRWASSVSNGEGSTAEISVSVAQNRRGEGWGPVIVQAGVRRLFDEIAVGHRRHRPGQAGEPGVVDLVRGRRLRDHRRSGRRGQPVGRARPPPATRADDDRDRVDLHRGPGDRAGVPDVRHRRAVGQPRGEPGEGPQSSSARRPRRGRTR